MGNCCCAAENSGHATTPRNYYQKGGRKFLHTGSSDEMDRTDDKNERLAQENEDYMFQWEEEQVEMSSHLPPREANIRDIYDFFPI